MLDFTLRRWLVPGTVVDYGAGIGLTALALARDGFAVTAVEAALDSDTVRFARFLRERLRIDGVEFTDRLPPGPVDNVLSIDVFEHFPDWTGPARDLARILAPGGTFGLTTSFGNPETDPDHPQHFDSPVEPRSFLESLGLEPVAPAIWRKRR